MEKLKRTFEKPTFKKLDEKLDEKLDVKRSKGRPKKYETEEERKMYKKVSSVNSANKTKFRKKLEPYNIKIGKDGLTYNEAVSYVIQRPEHFSTPIINLAKRIEPYLKEGQGLPDYEDLNWGSLTKQFKAFKTSHPNINSLEKFAKYIIGNKDEFQEKTIKRANFYLNVILKGKGLEDDSSSDSSSDGESYGENIISAKGIMPKFAKGSKQMKEHMAMLRAMKGHHNVMEAEMPYEGGAVLLPRGHLANRLDLSSYMPRNFNNGLSTTSMMNVPMSRTPRVINAGGIKPPPMLNSARQRYEGVESGSKLGAAGNMSYHSLMSL